MSCMGGTTRAQKPVACMVNCKHRQTRRNSKDVAGLVIYFTTPSRRLCSFGLAVELNVNTSLIGMARRSHLRSALQQEANRKNLVTTGFSCGIRTSAQLHSSQKKKDLARFNHLKAQSPPIATLLIASSAGFFRRNSQTTPQIRTHLYRRRHTCSFNISAVMSPSWMTYYT